MYPLGRSIARIALFTCTTPALICLSIMSLLYISLQYAIFPPHLFHATATIRFPPLYLTPEAHILARGVITIRYLTIRGPLIRRCPSAGSS
eukprot:6190253-Pleurochrysis_carterae.AAC.2